MAAAHYFLPIGLFSIFLTTKVGGLGKTDSGEGIKNTKKKTGIIFGEQNRLYESEGRSKITKKKFYKCFSISNLLKFFLVHLESVLILPTFYLKSFTLNERFYEF